LRKFLLADEEARLRHRGALGERQGEADLHLASLPHALARKIEARERAKPLGREIAPVGLRVGRAQHDHRQPLAPHQKLGEEAGEREHRIAGRRLGETLAEPDQFEERAVELHDVIFRAPGMAIARADLKAEPPIALGRRVEVAGGDDEVIQGAGHGASRYSSGRLLQLHHIVQRLVGVLEEPAHAARGLADALLVLDQRQTHIFVAVLAKADARRHGDIRLLDQQF